VGGGPSDLAGHEGTWFVDLSGWRKTRVTGPDAAAWLHDLVTADVAGLSPGTSRRSLLLTPTGRIRADFSVARTDDAFLLLQSPDQADDVADLLRPYRLSSQVEADDVGDALALFAVPDGQEATGLPELTPSVVGPGRDVLLPGDPRADERARPVRDLGLAEAGVATLESWRVRRGIPRMGADFAPGALPAEVALDHTIADKGCFLGQEAVAKVRNLGHPTRVLLHVSADGPLGAGQAIVSDDSEVGTVTSATEIPGGGWVALASVRWGSADRQLSSGGARLQRIRSSN
jgi:folate-binding protein YgfZ